MNTFLERRRDRMKFEEWLEQVPADALKELAGRGPEVHASSKPKTIQYILGDKWSRENAMESMRIEVEALARIKERGESPTKLWAERFALPW
jgi:hypothetical protein